MNSKNTLIFSKQTNTQKAFAAGTSLLLWYSPNTQIN